MNILIINQPLNNRGDESAHKALVRSLSKSMPNAGIKVLFVGEPADSVKQFSVKVSNVKYVQYYPVSLTDNIFYIKLYRRLFLDRIYSKYLNYALYKNQLWMWKLNPFIRPILKEFEDSHKIVNAPGGICMGGFQYWNHISYLSIAKLYNKDIYYYGRSFGPFPIVTKKNRRFKDISLSLLRYFRFLSIRDSRTQQLASEYNLTYTTTVDTAFLETPIVPIEQNIKEQIGENYSVLVPNVLIWHYAYKNIPKKRINSLYLRIIEEMVLNNKDCKIVMLPQTFNYSEPVMNDINYFKELKMLSPYKDKIVIIDDIYSSDIQQTIISNANYLIGARYHSVVFAINTETPFISLSYEHKIEGLLSTLDGLDNMIDITDLSNDIKIDEIVFGVKNKLKNLYFDVRLKEKASKIAYNCFNAFVDKLNE